MKTREEMIKQLLDDDLRMVVRLVKTGDFNELRVLLSYLFAYENLDDEDLGGQYDDRGLDDS